MDQICGRVLTDTPENAAIIAAEIPLPNFVRSFKEYSNVPDTFHCTDDVDPRYRSATSPSALLQGQQITQAINAHFWGIRRCKHAAIHLTNYIRPSTSKFSGNARRIIMTIYIAEFWSYLGGKLHVWLKSGNNNNGHFTWRGAQVSERNTWARLR